GVAAEGAAGDGEGGTGRGDDGTSNSCPPTVAAHGLIAAEGAAADGAIGGPKVQKDSATASLRGSVVAFLGHIVAKGAVRNTHWPPAIDTSPSGDAESAVVATTSQVAAKRAALDRGAAPENLDAAAKCLSEAGCTGAAKCLVAGD